MATGPLANELRNQHAILLPGRVGKFLKACCMQLIRRHGQAAVRITVTMQSALDALYVKRSTAQLFEHGNERTLCTEPSTLISILGRRGIVSCELFYENFHQRLSMSLAVRSEGKKEGLGKIVQDHSRDATLICMPIQRGPELLRTMCEL